MTSERPKGIHSLIAVEMLEEAGRLRARARAVERMDAPPLPPGRDRSPLFAELWAQAWRIECGVAADRLTDAAYVLEQSVEHATSPTADLVSSRLGAK